MLFFLLSALLYHLCSDVPAQCAELSRDCESGIHLSQSVADTVISMGLTSRRLLLNADALGVVVSSSSKHCRQPILSILVAKFRDMQNGSIASSSINQPHVLSLRNMFDAFDRLPRPALLAIASQHRLEHTPRATRDVLQQLIMAHISKGHCAESGRRVDCKSGCAAVTN